MSTKAENGWYCVERESYTLEKKSVVDFDVYTLSSLINIKQSMLYALLNVYARDG